MIPTFEQCMKEAHARRVTYRESDDGNYCIFNYAPEVEIKKWWNDVNVWCRGLIFDKNDTRRPVAVPFKKFWNVGQKPETQPEVLAEKGIPVAVQDKLDGSLGIVFWDRYNDRPRVSTRGSLESDQAKWATKWLNENLDDEDFAVLQAELFPYQNNHATHLVEIVYPANRIVVKYEFSGLVHLDTVLNVTGRGDLQHFGDSMCVIPKTWRRAESFPPESLSAFLDRAKDLPGMVEGFVLTYADGTKVKIKGNEYIHLHRIRFDLKARRIYEMLKQYTNVGEIQPTLDTMLAAVPDEFAEPVRECASTLVARYQKAWDDVTWYAETAQQEGRGERKKMALYGQAHLPKELLGSFFAILDDDAERAASLAWRAVDYTDLTI